MLLNKNKSVASNGMHQVSFLSAVFALNKHVCQIQLQIRKSLDGMLYLNCLCPVIHWKQYKSALFNVFLTNIVVFFKIHTFQSWFLQHITKKVGTVEHLPLCYITIPFTTPKRHLWTEDTKWWCVSCLTLPHSFCKQVAFFASKCAPDSLLEKGRNCSQDFVMCVECGFALPCWNMHWYLWKICILEGRILYLKNVSFSTLMMHHRSATYLCQ